MGATVSFDDRDIRAAMDVYTADNVYLGTVLRIIGGGATLREPGSMAAPQGSLVHGELLGPMLTQPIGTVAALRQGAAAAYATAPDAEPLGAGAIVVGRWWGMIGRRVIALKNVQTVALERIVLKQRRAELR